MITEFTTKTLSLIFNINRLSFVNNDNNPPLLS